MQQLGCAIGLVMSLIVGMFRPATHPPAPEPLVEPRSAPPSGPVKSGRASWFATGPDGLYAAAGPALRVGHWRGRRVWVTSGANSIRVTLNDWCQCYRGTSRERLLDLSDEAFRRLAPLSRGVIRVTVED